ncbi:DNA sulfur modification protein DndB [Gloeothece verrucosa]|uniref:DGQHR domain protein n=1 Tax=Gloeothece verrucosa (strain PCC 7822) TaxID=497965 RepID=E0UFG2_GLOV7|nr:DNA sulfur modification protein DndB [Gloeothece verrucosa]ADN16656.1 DGQHR domain protein [Gloeothece verrucosa PCC 7822]
MMSEFKDDSEHTPRLDELLEPYFAKYYREKCYPGLICQQGKRKMIQINVPAHDLPTLLQAKPSTGNDPDSGKNRPEIKGHAEEVKQYILKRAKQNKPWILGTLTANVDPEKIKLIQMGRGIALIVIPRGVKLDITDGQHRKQAIHDLIESPDAEWIGDNDFPVTLVLEANFNQCQTDFRDMAQTKALDKSLLLSFGEFEGRVGITKNLLEQVLMFFNKTEKIKNSPATKQKLIYTTNYIAKLVSCAFVNNPQDELEDYDVEQASQTLISCLNQFFAECSQTRHICETSIENLTVDNIIKFKDNCLLGTSVGLEILGRLLYCTYNEDNNIFAPEKVSKIAELDWEKSGNLWQGNVIKLDLNAKNTAKRYKISANVNPVNMAVHAAKTALGWLEY